MYLGFYTKRLRIVPAGRGSESQIRSKAWFRSRDCSKNYVFRQPQTAVSAVVFLHIPAEVFAKRPGVVVVYTGKGCDMECKKEI